MSFAPCAPAARSRPRAAGSAAEEEDLIFDDENPGESCGKGLEGAPFYVPLSPQHKCSLLSPQSDWDKSTIWTTLSKWADTEAHVHLHRGNSCLLFNLIFS